MYWEPTAKLYQERWNVAWLQPLVPVVTLLAQGQGSLQLYGTVWEAEGLLKWERLLKRGKKMGERNREK